MSLTNKRRAIKTSFTSSNNSKWFLKQQHQPQKHLQLWFKIVIIVVVIKLIPAMLPPPLTTPRTLSTTISGTTMGIQMTTTTNNHNHNHNHQQQQQHHNNLQQKQQQTQQHHYESAFFYESMNSSNDATPSNASASFATASSSTTNLKGLKTFLRKTLVNVTNTTVNDSLSLYTSSSVASQLPASSSSSSSSSSLPSSSREELYDDIVVGTISESVADGDGTGGFVGNITDDFGSYATAAAAADMAVMTLSNTTTHLETTTAAAAAFPSATQTVATFIAGNKNRATTIIVYPTVSPESIVIPIVSCIFGFPILAFIVICCLRHRAKLARERDRRRNYDMQDHAVSLVRFSPIHRLNYRSSRAISLRPERSLSQGFTSLELDTVVEERVSDVEQTQTEMLHPESPMESSTSYKMSLSSS